MGADTLTDPVERSQRPISTISGWEKEEQRKMEEGKVLNEERFTEVEDPVEHNQMEDAQAVSEEPVNEDVQDANEDKEVITELEKKEETITNNPDTESEKTDIETSDTVNAEGMPPTVKDEDDTPAVVFKSKESVEEEKEEIPEEIENEEEIEEETEPQDTNNCSSPTVEDITKPLSEVNLSVDENNEKGEKEKKSVSDDDELQNISLDEIDIESEKVKETNDVEVTKVQDEKIGDLQEI